MLYFRKLLYISIRNFKQSTFNIHLSFLKALPLPECLDKPFCRNGRQSPLWLWSSLRTITSSNSSSSIKCSPKYYLLLYHHHQCIRKHDSMHTYDICEGIHIKCNSSHTFPQPQRDTPRDQLLQEHRITSWLCPNGHCNTKMFFYFSLFNTSFIPYI